MTGRQSTSTEKQMQAERDKVGYSERVEEDNKRQEEQEERKRDGGRWRERSGMIRSDTSEPSGSNPTPITQKSRVLFFDPEHFEHSVSLVLLHH